jgi:hypothetical protein
MKKKFYIDPKGRGMNFNHLAAILRKHRFVKLYTAHYTWMVVYSPFIIKNEMYLGCFIQSQWYQAESLNLFEYLWHRLPLRHANKL